MQLCVLCPPKCLHRLTEQHWEDLKAKGIPMPKDKSKSEATLAVMEAPEEAVHEQFLRDVDQLLHWTTTDLGVISGEEGRKREAVLAAEHEKEAHLPKDPACPVCVEEEGTRITHSKKDPHYGTLCMDTGMMDCISDDGCKYFLAGLRLKGSERKPVIVPFFVPLPNRAVPEIAKAVGETIRFTENCKYLRPCEGCLVRRIVSDQGTEFMNQTLQAKAEEWGVHWATSPAYQPASNGIAERLIGLAKTIVRRLLFAAELEPKFW